MLVLLLLLGGTALAVLLLVLYSHYLFEENRTRVSRSSEVRHEPAAELPTAGELQWRTVVDPVEAATRAQSSKPFAVAYSRAASAAYDDRDSRAA